MVGWGLFCFSFYWNSEFSMPIAKQDRKSLACARPTVAVERERAMPCCVTRIDPSGLYISTVLALLYVSLYWLQKPLTTSLRDDFLVYFFGFL